MRTTTGHGRFPREARQVAPGRQWQRCAEQRLMPTITANWTDRHGVTPRSAASPRSIRRMPRA